MDSTIIIEGVSKYHRIISSQLVSRSQTNCALATYRLPQVPVIIAGCLRETTSQCAHVDYYCNSSKCFNTKRVHHTVVI